MRNTLELFNSMAKIQLFEMTPRFHLPFLQ